jgi:hypothetical protein
MRATRSRTLTTARASPNSTLTSAPMSARARSARVRPRPYCVAGRAGRGAEVVAGVRLGVVATVEVVPGSVVLTAVEVELSGGSATVVVVVLGAVVVVVVLFGGGGGGAGSVVVVGQLAGGVVSGHGPPQPTAGAAVPQPASTSRPATSRRTVSRP